VEELNDQTKTRPILEAGRDYLRTYREFVELIPDNESLLPIWRSYDGLMVLFVQSVILFQSLGIKLREDWFAPDVATKHQ
jgi:hypothetical protein